MTAVSSVERGLLSARSSHLSSKKMRAMFALEYQAYRIKRPLKEARLKIKHLRRNFLNLQYLLNRNSKPSGA